MSVQYSGKCGVKSLNRVDEEPFETYELDLSARSVDNVDSIIDACRSYQEHIVSVHTPSISVNSDHTPVEVLEATDKIAYQLDALLTIDINPVGTRYARSVISKSTLRSEFAVENDPSVSEFYILQLGYNHHPIQLDTAHLHMSVEDTKQAVERIVSRSTNTDEYRLPAIHLADGTLLNDGVPFGDGTIPVRDIADILDAYDYTGVVVLETDQEYQVDALEYIDGNV